MKRTDTCLPGVYLFEPDVFRDQRGFFLESYNVRDLQQAGLETPFVQDNHSRSAGGVLRGLHYQLGQPQAKLVRVARGEIFDVAVDIRRGSPTFGRCSSARLSDENHRMLYVPEGFAHGFYVLSETADVIYKCSDYYAPAEERGLAWNDPQLAIDWPLSPGDGPVLSAKDRSYKTLAETPQDELPMYTDQPA